MSLFELRVLHLVPPIGEGKTIRTNAIAEDGFDYAVKSAEKHPLLPVSEWLCYRLAGALALSLPASAVLVMPDGSRVFGSRIESGLARMEKLVREGTAPEMFLAACADRLSVVYAIDLFVANIDRHFGNFLFGENSLGQRTVMPIDFGHALLVGGWPLPSILEKPNPTTTHLKILRHMDLFRAPAALMALGTLSQINAVTVERWFDQVPVQWIQTQQKNALIDWWNSDDFNARVSKCVEYCQP